MAEIVNGKQSVEVLIDKSEIFDRGTWFFCQNGYQSTGVDISVEQFDMIKELVVDPDVVEFYENLRKYET